MQRGQNSMPGMSSHTDRELLFPFTFSEEHRKILGDRDLYTSYLEDAKEIVSSF